MDMIIHIPHSSMLIPEVDRVGFTLSYCAILQELNKLNDHFTDLLFDRESFNSIVFPVNRFLVDVERFEDDDIEPMAKKGMGVLYTHDTNGLRFRAKLKGKSRERLLDKYYRPHHSRLTQLCLDALERSGSCVIIDGHSFPNEPLPCDDNQLRIRPDICLGACDYHTPEWLLNIAYKVFNEAGYSVAINQPYKGTIVPLTFFEVEAAVCSLMVEVNRSLYLDEQYQINQTGYAKVKKCIDLIYSQIEQHQ